MGVPRSELKPSLEHVIEVPQSTLDNERIHGYGSVVKKSHPYYHLVQFLIKLYLAYTRNLVLPPIDHTRLRLLSEIELIQRRRPNKVSAKGMFLGERTKHAVAQLLSTSALRRRATAKSVVKYHGDGWKKIGFAMKAYYGRLAEKRKQENRIQKEEDLQHAESALMLHDEREGRMSEFYSHTLRSQEFRLTNDDHNNLQLAWTSKRMGHEEVKQKEKEISQPVGFFDEQRFQDLLRLRETHLGPEEITTPTYEWVREVCRRYLWFEGSVLCVTSGDEADKFYLLRNIGVATHELMVMPLERIMPSPFGDYCVRLVPAWPFAQWWTQQ